MTPKLLVLPVVLALTTFAHAGAPPNARAQAQRLRRVDLVLAIDTSSSMDGLIDAARQKMWDVVNLLSKAQPRPELRVGLLSYGNTGYSAQAGWVRTEADLTSDLDTVYGKLFGLTTNGGDEYVARAVKVATDSMSWSKDQDALRIVFVAGNESATQDPLVPLPDAIAAARQRGIYVNTIFCGSEHAGDAVGWAQAAALGKGQFAAINQHRVVAIATPQDEELRRLSEELNKTYVAYGARGRSALANQAAQDKNAERASAPAAASRAAGKASGLYRADDWDLVDATAHGDKKPKTMPAAELPPEMREMEPEARTRYVEEKAKQRADIQAHIRKVNAERERYLAAERKKSATKAGGAGMDDAMLGGIQKEAEASGFAF